MVAFLPALSISLVSLFFAVTVLQPRLPQYSFTIRRLVPKWVDRRFKAQVGAGVKMQNDNFVQIDIHALSFDLFYPNWQGDLHHIGNVHDTQQRTCDRDEAAVDDYSTDDTDSLCPSAALWALHPRQLFETSDNVFMVPSGGVGVLSSLSWDLMKQWGEVQLPSTGVIHLKANGKIPLTLSIFCHNVLNTWSMEMKGLTCSLDNIDLGWVHLDNTADGMRNKIIGQPHRPHEALIDNKKPLAASLEKEIKRMERKQFWKNALSKIERRDKKKAHPA